MPTYASVMTQSPPQQTYNPVPMDSLTPMEIYVTHLQGPLLDKEKQ